jgi:very-short-patch-repair endonuclease
MDEPDQPDLIEYVPTDYSITYKDDTDQDRTAPGRLDRAAEALIWNLNMRQVAVDAYMVSFHKHAPDFIEGTQVSIEPGSPYNAAHIDAINETSNQFRTYPGSAQYILELELLDEVLAGLHPNIQKGHTLTWAENKCVTELQDIEITGDPEETIRLCAIEQRSVKTAKHYYQRIRFRGTFQQWTRAGIDATLMEKDDDGNSICVRKDTHYSLSSYLNRKGNLIQGASSFEVKLRHELGEFFVTDHSLDGRVVGGHPADIVFHQEKIIVEYDGVKWHESATRIKSDLKQTYNFEKHGYSVIRIRPKPLPLITPNDIQVPHGCRAYTVAALVIEKIISLMEASGQVVSSITREQLELYTDNKGPWAAGAAKEELRRLLHRDI